MWLLVIQLTVRKANVHDSVYKVTPESAESSWQLPRLFLENKF
jgi:hypothetical protein